MLNLDAINLIDDNISDLEEQGLPECAKDLHTAVRLLQQDGDVLVRSSTKPAGGGYLPTRISLHAGNDATPYVTHLEAQQEDGKWARMQGHYHRSLAEAVDDYLVRCITLEVTE